MKEFLKYISLARLEQFGSQMHVWHRRYDEIRAVKQIWAYRHIIPILGHQQKSFSTEQMIEHHHII